MRLVPRKLSSFRLVAMQTLRRSWTRWSLRKTRRQAVRAARRLILLQVETDSQLLRLKELEQREQQLVHRQLESLESWDFRQGKLILLEQDPVKTLLGL